MHIYHSISHYLAVWYIVVPPCTTVYHVSFIMYQRITCTLPIRSVMRGSITITDGGGGCSGACVVFDESSLSIFKGLINRLTSEIVWRMAGESKHVALRVDTPR